MAARSVPLGARSERTAGDTAGVAAHAAIRTTLATTNKILNIWTPCNTSTCGRCGDYGRRRPIAVVWRPVRQWCFRRGIEHRGVDAPNPIVVDDEELAEQVASLRSTGPAD